MRKSGKTKGGAKSARAKPGIIDYGNDLQFKEEGDKRRTRKWFIVLEKHVPGKGKRRWRRTEWGHKPSWYPA